MVAAIEYTSAKEMMTAARDLRAKLFKKLPTPKKGCLVAIEKIPVDALSLKKEQYLQLNHHMVTYFNYSFRVKKKRRYITSACIVEKVSQEFLVSVALIMGTKKPQYVVDARFVCYYLIWSIKEDSLPTIGAYFGRDHTTILNGIRKVAKIMASSTEMAATINKIRIDLLQ